MRWQWHPRENWYRDVVLFIIVVVLFFVVKAVVDRVDDVEESRFNAFVAACEESNQHNEETIKRLHEVVAEQPPDKRKEAEASIPATILLINALQPKRESCHAYAEERTAKDGGKERAPTGASGTPPSSEAAPRNKPIPKAALRVIIGAKAKSASSTAPTGAARPPPSATATTTAPAAPPPATAPALPTTSAPSPPAPVEPPATIPALPPTPPIPTPTVPTVTTPTLPPLP